MRKLWLYILIHTGLASSQGTAMQNPSISSYHNSVQLGPRPYYLIENMSDSPLKKKLKSCQDMKMKKTDFSIGHRGAPLQFPEHTQESYVAAARMGVGILECDVTFTKDLELVCRHSQCDLHTTTNILNIPPLAAKCSKPFSPYDPKSQTPASARCCTSDITLREFKSLCGKMDAFNPKAHTVSEFLNGTANYRTDLYSSCGTVLSHKESIQLFQTLGVKMIPELKKPSVAMPFMGVYSQEDFAQQLIEEYKEAGVPSNNIWAQSFNLSDILYWLRKEPSYGRQAVFLDGRYEDSSFDHRNPETWTPSMAELKAKGVNYLAPPLWMLLDLDAKQKIIPSLYAESAKQKGLELITWTLERSGLLESGGGWYYQTITDAIDQDGDMYETLDVLAQDVGIVGIFSDWPATATYYASCMGLP